MSCIFCKIINKKIPAQVVFEDEDVIAFKDIKPIAPVHIVIIPKKHIISIADLEDDEEVLMGKLIMTAKRIAEDLKISDRGYKLLVRVGKEGGQEIDHIHLHLLGGTMLAKNI
ncbi:histidine triad nucleotide-binding protein [Candidatus Parcubacteria bacterium]|nr:histidine triad nucleotide-binding protein [Candidatus Parcubacteria bacterium]